MISPREAWLEHRVKYLEDELRRATGHPNPSRVGSYENPLDLTVKDFRVTEMVRVTAKHVVDEDNPCMHVRTSMYRGKTPFKEAMLGAQYMVSDDLLVSMTDPARLQILNDMHFKVIHEYSRKIWGSPFESGSQGND